MAGTGANTCAFSGWTAYSTVDTALCGAQNIGDGTVTVINQDITWSGDVNLNGKVVVLSPATLTIEPGTVVKAAFKADPVDASAIVIARGGTIIANGTAALPIVLTTEYDPLTAGDVAAGIYVADNFDLTIGGLWGGLIVLGDNVIGEDGGVESIEGIVEGETWTEYGGSETNDSSGSMKYISIRHGGATIGNGDEINGLTLGGVGNGTVIENIEIVSNTDDGIEFFGGNVNVNNLLIYNQTDDAIDIDEAYSGTVTNSLVVLGAGSDNVFEIDGSEDSTGAVTGSYTINKVTAVGATGQTQMDQYGHWKSGATGANNNVVFKDFATGTYVEGIESSTFNAGTLTFSNLDFVTSDDLATVNSISSRSASDELGELTSTHAEILAEQANGSGSTETQYYDWTAYFYGGYGNTLSSGDLQEVDEFKIYPNPVNDVLNVSSNVPVKSLKLFNITGQLVKTNENLNSLDMSEVSRGIYLLEISSDTTVQTKKIVKK